MNIRQIIVKTGKNYKSKKEKKLDEQNLRMMDSSPFMLALYICGILGMLFSAGGAIGLDGGPFILLMPIVIIINLTLWFLYFYHTKLFMYIAGGITLVCIIIAVPEIYNLANTIKYVILSGLPLSNVNFSASLVISMLILLSFLFFALEFVIRSHSLMMTIGLGILILVPLSGADIGIIPLIMLVIYEIGFAVVNMTEKRSLKNVMRSSKRARVNMISTLITAAVVILSFVPAFIIEQNNEEDLFSAVYKTDSFIKDTVSALMHGTNQGVSGGMVSRGNLYQTGAETLVITTDKRPDDILYLQNFRGENYSDSEWDNAYTLFSDRMNNTFYYRERFMPELLEYIDDSAEYEPESFKYLVSGASDITTEMYFLLAEDSDFQVTFEPVVIDGEEYYTFKEVRDRNTSASEIYVKHLNEDYYSGFYVPYFSKKSEYRIGFEGGLSREKGYSNEYLTPEEINMSQPAYENSDGNDGTFWDINPFYEKFIDSYMEYIQREYTSYPQETFQRMVQLCKETPLTDLDDITTYILVTLQNRASYSTSPGSTPFNKDVVDYFLFDNGLGYCVHFASAATLMYRMYGIPARYVSGYVVNPGQFEETSNEYGETVYTCTLTDHYAHAWTEIFLKDYGWVPVEVTPSTEGVMVAHYPGYTRTDMYRIMKEHGWSFKGNSSSGTSQAVGGDDDEANSGFFIIIIFSAVIIIGFALFITIRHIRFRRSVPKLNCLRLFDLIIRCLRCMRQFREITGSEENFIELITNEFGSVDKDEAARMMDIILAANYDENEVPREDRDFVEQFYRKLSDEVCRKLFFIRRPVYRLIRNL